MDNLLLKNCFFVTVKLVRNEIKSKIYLQWLRKGPWSFAIDFARNVFIFGVYIKFFSSY